MKKKRLSKLVVIRTGWYLYLIVLFSSIAYMCSAQIQRMDTSYFVLDRAVYLESDDTILSVNFGHQFCVYRTFLSKNEFIEKSFFGEQIFKVSDKKWKVKINGVWKTIFSEKKFKKFTMTFDSYYFVLIPWERSLAGSDWEYKYYLVGKDELSNVTPLSYVVFSPSKGFLRIVDGDVILTKEKYRPDVFPECN